MNIFEIYSYVFVLDGSGSIGASNFQSCLDFVQLVVNEFEIGPGNYQIGVQQFSTGKYRTLYGQYTTLNSTPSEYKSFVRINRSDQCMP